ncbi:MAG: NAD-dependent epimerase/dehydratase family protein [Candidatus Hodarchaeales archaeon]
MKVLLTGAFGNIGESTLLVLMEKGYQIRCFDIKTKNTEKTATKLSKLGKIGIKWGNITDKESLNQVIEGIDSIIHLAAIIPPLSEKNPDLARKVNVEGTRNLIEIASQMETKPRFIFSSSVSIYGPRHLQPAPLKVDDPLVPTDNYTNHKVECEKIIRNSGLPWTILRFTAIPPINIGSEIDPMFFNIPYDQRIEFGHTRDAGRACANAVEADTVKKILLIAGGEKCQMINGEFINGIFGSIGLSELPREAFLIPQNEDEWYYTDWLDTAESQALLNYQHHSYEDYLEELRRKMGIKRVITRILGPLIKKQLLKKSPYYKENTA